MLSKFCQSPMVKLDYISRLEIIITWKIICVYLIAHETKSSCQKWDSNPHPQKWTAT